MKGIFNTMFTQTYFVILQGHLSLSIFQRSIMKREISGMLLTSYFLQQITCRSLSSRHEQENWGDKVNYAIVVSCKAV
jgi:hypothetical protein